MKDHGMGGIYEMKKDHFDLEMVRNDLVAVVGVVVVCSAILNNF